MEHGGLGLVVGVLVLCEDGLHLCEETPDSLYSGDFVRVFRSRAVFAENLEIPPYKFALAETLLNRRQGVLEEIRGKGVPALERRQSSPELPAWFAALPVRYCANSDCQKVLIPNRYQYNWETQNQFLARRTCSHACSWRVRKSEEEVCP